MIEENSSPVDSGSVFSYLQFSKTFFYNCSSTCSNWIHFFYFYEPNSNYGNQTLNKRSQKKKSFLMTYWKSADVETSECDKMLHANSLNKFNQVLIQGTGLHLRLPSFARSPFYLIKTIAWLKRNEVKIRYASFKIKHTITTPFYLELSTTFIM